MKFYKNYPDPRGTEVVENVESENISEYGGGGGELVVHELPADGEGKIYLDKTWAEITEAMKTNGSVEVIATHDDEYTRSIEVRTRIIKSEWDSSKSEEPYGLLGMYLTLLDPPSMPFLKFAYTCSSSSDYPYRLESIT